MATRVKGGGSPISGPGKGENVSLELIDIINDPNAPGYAEFNFGEGYMGEDWSYDPSMILINEGLGGPSAGINPIIGQNLLKALGRPLCRPGDPFCK